MLTSWTPHLHSHLFSKEYRVKVYIGLAGNSTLECHNASFWLLHGGFDNVAVESSKFAAGRVNPMPMQNGKGTLLFSVSSSLSNASLYMKRVAIFAVLATRRHTLRRKFQIVHLPVIWAGWIDHSNRMTGCIYDALVNWPSTRPWMITPDVPCWLKIYEISVIFHDFR